MANTEESKAAQVMGVIIVSMEAADQLLNEIASVPELVAANPRLASAVLNYIVTKFEAARVIKDFTEETNRGDAS